MNDSIKNLLDKKLFLVREINKLQEELIYVEKQLLDLNSLSIPQFREITTGNEFEIEVSNLETWKGYGIIYFPVELRKYFPGYEVDFELSTDNETIITHVTSAPDETEVGDLNEGKYLCGNLRPWFRRHIELRNGDKLSFTKISSKRYKLEIIKTEGG
ncbi:MAG: hypothetical protein DRQ13_07190 [Ignavibacteriae bacterium]|nr:MAG: hypothetical protein DRQ13_07190 [Ignavibacteriota bacterium]